MKAVLSVLTFVLSGSVAMAGPEDFTDGPVINGFGKTARVDTTALLDQDTYFRVAFDTSKSGGEEVNRTLNSAARFINMHARAGISPEKIDIAVVLHGKAVKDVTKADGTPNAELLALLGEHGVRVILCGQSAAYYDVANDDLLPGVEMAISAMTAHALLQQDGYTLNPF